MGLRKHSEHEPLREVAAREFPRDTDGLIAQLRTSDPEQRRWAARDLAAHPRSAAALGERLAGEPDASVREALFTSLAAHASETAAAVLLPLLRSEDAALRNGAIETLAEMPDAVAPRIGALLKDGDADVRIFTVNLLAELRHPNVLAWLVQVLQHDTQVNVVAAAIEALAEAGGPDQVPALRAARARFAGDDFIGFAAEMAAERMQAP
jgi:HEAT repeat protein